MSKIICDICGTSYQETAKQCPICGCVRPGDAQRVGDGGSGEGKVSTGYTYVKGGRFSKSNVKKRNKKKAENIDTVEKPEPNETNEPENRSNRGLVITAVVLLLAIIGVVIYITIRFFGPISNPNNGNATTENVGNYEDLACTDIALDVETILFEQAGEARLLSVTLSPKNTVDKVTYKSEDPAVATVSDKGNIVAVGEGTTKITVTCGNVTKECIVTCQFIEESTETVPESSETVPESSEAPAVVLKLNREDITFSYKGASWVLYDGSIPKNQITWSSDDESIVTFDNGKAVAVGGGTTYIHAEYEDQKVSCIIRCSFSDSTDIGGNGGVTEDGGIPGNGGVSEDGGSGNGGVTEDGGNNDVVDNKNYYIYTQYGSKTEDCTITVGESVRFYLKDENGNAVEATWSTNSSALSLSGSTVKGVSKTSYAKVTAVYNGKGYECIVRVN